MRILGIDEIPEEWKKQLDQTGLLRYGLFIEELDRVSLVSVKSLKQVIDILKSIRGEGFPYRGLRIGKPTEQHWKKINQPTHMGVFIENDGKIKLLEGTLDNTLMPTKWDDTDLSNITL